MDLILWLLQYASCLSEQLSDLCDILLGPALQYTDNKWVAFKNSEALSQNSQRQTVCLVGIHLEDHRTSGSLVVLCTKVWLEVELGSTSPLGLSEAISSKLQLLLYMAGASSAGASQSHLSFATKFLPQYRTFKSWLWQWECDKKNHGSLPWLVALDKNFLRDASTHRSFDA